MYYKVANATHAVANVDDFSGSARLLAATTLRNVLGTLTLGDILCHREAIARDMKVSANSISTQQNNSFYCRPHLMREQSHGE